MAEASMHHEKRATGWTSRSVGSRLQHAIFYQLIALGGWRAGYALLFFVISFYSLTSLARERCAPYLTRRFPACGPLGLWRHRWRLLWKLGQVLVDRSAAGIRREFTSSASKTDEDTLAALHAEGRGLILLGAHIGAWQMAMADLHGIIPGHMHAVMHRDALDVDRHYFEHGGEAPPFGIIDPAEGPASVLAMMAALGRGETLGIMGDRLFGGDRHIVNAPFLGGEIRLPSTAYRLAAATGAPIALFFALRSAPCRIELRIAGVIRVPEEALKQKNAIEPQAEKFAKAMEGMTEIAPYQFFNFFDMWSAGQAT